MTGNRPKLWALLVLVLGGAGAFASTPSAHVEAADHLDPPLRTNPMGTPPGMEREADIADVYAWHDSDSVTLIMSFDGPNAPDFAMPCPRDVLYQLHIDNDGDGADPDSFDDEFTIDTRFGADDDGNCMVSVSGIPGLPTGVSVQGLVGHTMTRGAGAGPTISVFAGLRDDAFFFDLQGFRTVTGGGGLIMRDGAGNPVLDGAGNPVLNFVNDRDFFAGLNTPAIVVEFPLLTVSPTNQVFRVWASSARITP